MAGLGTGLDSSTGLPPWISALRHLRPTSRDWLWVLDRTGRDAWFVTSSFLWPDYGQETAKLTERVLRLESFTRLLKML